MHLIEENYRRIRKQLDKNNVSLVAVSKFKSKEDITSIYNVGQYDFGENYVQELVEKYSALPKDIRWHFIGHLQSNKVKQLAPFIYLIHSVDSVKLLTEINNQGEKNGRIISCLLQVHIAVEETKYGFDEEELENIEPADFPFVQIKGLMGMATFTENTNQVQDEFKKLHRLFELFKMGNPRSTILSMGMSNDFEIAITQGSNMVRIGSLIFGERSQPAS